VCAFPVEAVHRRRRRAAERPQQGRVHPLVEEQVHTETRAQARRGDGERDRAPPHLAQRQPQVVSCHP